MKLLKKNDCGFDFIISKYLHIFTEYDYWFIYFELPKYTIRISNLYKKIGGIKYGFY